ncbi:MAG TPA: response regulator transcription factor [Anaerolineaceae bacterium]|jgi:DNA-binding response OmpR family regulator|nr:response regulator transcription factor [Anaerolineales bacterium]HOG59059.1 response regulator transcription factor [Anaerolineaceae bacterium]HOR84120.1 response regulator transcription factor [Anaerolineaceae bacterium]HPL42394.1 response regulator transcription factor [Anaerolineaceae bacterium]HPY32651.1 response regulator transcription factor [Anaerolineaceae bacterium]
MPLILVVEDEKELNKLLQAYLTRAGYRALGAFSGDEGLRLYEQEKPDLVLLDLNLPGKDGLELAREMRKSRDVPIIMATARVDEIDRLIGLELGADDYVSKPYSPREVVARVKAVLRRGARVPQQAPVLTLGKLRLDIDAHQTALGGKQLELTPTEFGILQLLVSQPGRVFTRLQLLEAAQGTSYEGYERSVDVHVKNLRRKLKEADPAGKYIETVFGVGYRANRMED